MFDDGSMMRPFLIDSEFNGFSYRINDRIYRIDKQVLFTKEGLSARLARAKCDAVVRASVDPSANERSPGSHLVHPVNPVRFTLHPVVSSLLPPVSRNSTAMRTATPLVTWSRITE